MLSVIIILLLVVSAFAKGVKQKIQFHYYRSIIFEWRFKRYFKIYYKGKFYSIQLFKEEFWNPELSSSNKYTSKLPFAKTLLVPLTDAWHLFQLIQLSALQLIITILITTLEPNFLIKYLGVDPSMFFSTLKFIIIFFSIKTIHNYTFEYFFGNKLTSNKYKKKHIKF